MVSSLKRFSDKVGVIGAIITVIISVIGMIGTVYKVSFRVDAHDLLFAKYIPIIEDQQVRGAAFQARIEQKMDDLVATSHATSRDVKIIKNSGGN